MNLGGEDGYRGIQSPRGAGFADQRRPVLEGCAGYLDFGSLGLVGKEGDQAEQYRYDDGRANGECDAHAKRLGAGGKELLRIDTHDHSPRHMPRITMPTMIPRRMVATVKARRYPAHISKSTSSSPPSASGARSQSFFRYPDGRA